MTLASLLKKARPAPSLSAEGLAAYGFVAAGCLVLGLVAFCREASGESLLNQIGPKMYVVEVSRTVGPPLERIEKEAKRVDVWVYPEGKVVFHNGRVVGLKSSSSSLPTPLALEAAAEKPSSNVSYRPQSKKPRTLSGSAFRSMLSEIPSDESGEKSGPGSPFQAGLRTPPMINQLGVPAVQNNLQE